MNSEVKKVELKGKTLEGLEEYFQSIGEKRFRADQVFNWMYNNLAMDFSEMQNLPKELRDKLSNDTTLQTLFLKKIQ